MKPIIALATVTMLAFGCQAMQARADSNPPAAPAGDVMPTAQPGDPAPGGPPPDGPPGGPPGFQRWAHRMGPMGMMDHGPGDRDGGMMMMGLFAPTASKNLSEADVKTIAQAMLLEHGNHSWTVADVATAPDKTIGFSFVTAHGDTVARFSIDPATGALQRLS